MTAIFSIDSLNSSFEKKELDNFLSKFDQVILLSFDKECLKLGSAKLHVEIMEMNSYSTFEYFIKSAKFYNVFLKEFFSTINYLLNLKQYFIVISTFLRANYMAGKMEFIFKKYSLTAKDTICYSFWFNNWVTAYSILKYRDKDLKIISRAHGADLFEERVDKIKKIPFRKFQLNKVNKVFSVSKMGANYLRTKYPQFENKIFTFPLGTNSFGINPFENKVNYSIVSCARVRNIKRIHLIPEILLLVDFPLTWYHIGGRNEMDPTVELLDRNLKILKQKNKFVEVIFLGDLSNEEVMKFYLKEQINAFISVSETEALPVSMMEAISFGIPIIATDVGGCKEIVNEKTGLLIPVDFKAKSMAETLKSFLNSHRNTKSYRDGVRLFWELEYDNNRNFEKAYAEMLI